MKKTHRILAYAAAAAMVLGSAAQALEPALDPLPDLSRYPTQLLVDGQAVEEGAMPRYLSGTVLLPLRNILEQAGYTVEWDAQAQGAAFSLDSAGIYLLRMADGTLTLDGFQGGGAGWDYLCVCGFVRLCGRCLGRLGRCHQYGGGHHRSAPGQCVLL